MAQQFVGFDFTPETSSDPVTAKSQALPCPLTRRPHRWSEEQKTVLLALNRWFTSREGEISLRDRKTILCKFFELSLLDCDGNEKVSKEAITSQLYELFMVHGARSDCWKRVYGDTDFKDPTGRFADTKLRLHHIARLNDIDIVPREFEDRIMIYQSAGSKDASNSKRRRRETESESEIDEEVNMCEFDSGDEGQFGSGKKPSSKTPKANRTQTQGSLTPPDSHPRQVIKAIPSTTAVPKTPSPSRVAYNIWKNSNDAWRGRLAFRFNDSFSHTKYDAGGFWPSAFYGKSLPTEEATPPDFSEPRFGVEAKIHLRPQLVPSKWISLFKNIRPALHRALRSKDDLSHVAIVDLDYLGSNPIHGQKRLFQASSVIEKWNIIGYNYENQGEYAYSGCAEWITWGRIEPAAIVANFWIGRLRKHLDKYPSLGNTLSIDEFGKSVNSTHYKRILKSNQLPMDEQRGFDTGGFLAFAGLPQLYLEKVALAMAKAWCFTRRREKRQKTESEVGVEPYLKGVLAGFRDYDPPQDRGPPRPLPGRLLSEHNLHHLDHSADKFDIDITESISRLEIDLTVDEDDSTDGSEDFELIDNGGTPSKPSVSIYNGGIWTSAPLNEGPRSRKVSNAGSDVTIQGTEVGNEAAKFERERSILGEDAFARRRRDINKAMGPRARGPLNMADLDTDSAWGGLQGSQSSARCGPSTLGDDQGSEDWIDVDKETVPNSVVDLTEDEDEFTAKRRQIKSFMAPSTVKGKEKATVQPKTNSRGIFGGFGR